MLHLVLGRGTCGARRRVRVDVRTKEDLRVWVWVCEEESGLCVIFVCTQDGTKNRSEYGRALEAPTI